MDKILDFDIHGDDRGSLISIENSKNIPFDVKRVYYIYGTKKDVARGKHAHKNLQQVLICVSGSCKVSLDDGKKREVYKLDNPAKGLLIDSLIWREMYDFSEDCVLLVLANKYYAKSDYIREYKEFMEIANEKK